MRVFYLRNRDRFPVACIASRKVKGDVVEFAMSIHNPVDKYNKALGRQLAKGRLLEGKAIASVRAPFKANVVRMIAEMPDLPNRVRKVANQWIKDNDAISAIELIAEAMR